MAGKCPRCKGTGDEGGNHEREWIKCTRCNGSGELPEGFSLTIPLALFAQVGPNTLGIYQPERPEDDDEALPTVDSFPYHYGPTENDPDPGKKWHIGCGGEVLFIEDGLICAKCGAQAEG